jgi:glycosyltransferase involved in cell wall biosynthesis
VAEPLSFCMVTTFYPPHHFGGDALYVYRLANALGRRGHRVTVVHSADAFAALRGMPSPELPHDGHVTVHALRSGLGAVGSLAVYLSGRPALHGPALRRIFARERFDVVHFHNVSLVGGPGVLRYGDGLKLYTMHEHWLVCPMHVLWKLNREPCERPECLRCTFAFRRPPQLWRYTSLLERSLGHVDLFLSPSRFTIRAHEARGFTQPIEHLPLFLPADGAGRPTGPDAGQEGVRPHERMYALFAGRLERIKGVDTLIEAFRRYRGCDLLIAGTGTQEQALRRRAAGLEHVRFLGRVEHTRLRRLYAGAIAVVVPSVGYEVFPYVPLEAFAESTPVVVRKIGGLPEVVEESGGGFVFSDEDGLLAALDELRRDPDRRRELGGRGRAALARLWSEEAHLERYFDLLDGAQGRSAALPASRLS